MKDILISIITPTYNAGSTILDCIESVKNQTFKNYEHIIIDNCSIDDTLKILETCRNREKIKIVSESDSGVYDAMNKGIDCSRGDYLFFLGSDDLFYDEETLNRIFAKNVSFRNYDLIYGDSIFLSTGRKYYGKFNKLKLYERNICHQAIFYHKRVFNKLGFYDLRYNVLSDYHLNIRVFNTKGIRIKYLKENISYYNDLSGLTVDNQDKHFYTNWNNISHLFPGYVRWMKERENVFFVRALRKLLYQPLSKVLNI